MVWVGGLKPEVGGPWKSMSYFQWGHNWRFDAQQNATYTSTPKPQGMNSKNFKRVNKKFLSILGMGYSSDQVTCRFKKGVPSNLPGTGLLLGSSPNSDKVSLSGSLILDSSHQSNGTCPKEFWNECYLMSYEAASKKSQVAGGHRTLIVSSITWVRMSRWHPQWLITI